jgi:nucleotide-binding universal stress UspA family protein
MNGTVIVGTDGSAPAARAVVLAAREAARLGSRLRVVAVSPWPHLPHTAAGLAPGAVLDADAVLREAADTARAALPAGRVETEAALGWPADALVRESAQARLLVVGSRGVGGVAALFLGSISTEVASRAQCPVLVARGETADPAPGAPVVVGVDAGRRSATALEEAFRYAQDTGCPLLAVHAWHPPHFVAPSQVPAAAEQALHRQSDEDALLAAVLEPYRAAYPQVAVSAAATPAEAADALVEAGANARLLVVGARGRGELTGLALGSTSQSLLRRAPCPVLVVKASAAVPAGSTPLGGAG